MILLIRDLKMLDFHFDFQKFDKADDDNFQHFLSVLSNVFQDILINSDYSIQGFDLVFCFSKPSQYNFMSKDLRNLNV